MQVSLDINVYQKLNFTIAHTLYSNMYVICYNNSVRVCNMCVFLVGCVLCACDVVWCGVCWVM